MTVNFDTAKTGIFCRLGKIFGIMDRTADFQSDVVGNASKSFQEAVNEYVNALGATDNTKLDYAKTLISNLDGLRNQVANPIWSRLLIAAQTTLVEMMNDDTKLPRKTVKEALIELRNQMDGASETLDGTTITIGTPSNTGTGNGTAIISALPDKTYHSKITQYPTARSETLVFRCVRDSTAKNVVPGNEVFRLEGEESFPPEDHRWPGGSGTRQGIVCTSDNLGDGRSPMRNMLRNSNFENWSSNTPAAWEIATGSAGSHVYQESSTVARGSNCLKMASNGSTLIRVHQRMDHVTGTPSVPSSDVMCAVSFLARKGGTTSSAGSLRYGLAQSDGTGVSGSYANVAHGSISASGWTHVTNSFRCANGGAVPDPLYFMLQQSTAFTSGTNLFIDGLVFATMYKTAPGGVSCCIVPGTTDFLAGDKISVQITNNGEGTMESMMDRFFDLYNRGVFYPQNLAGSETIDDALIS